MKPLEETKHLQAIFLRGRSGSSGRVHRLAKERYTIMEYKAVFWDDQPGHGVVEASQETDHKFDITLNENRVRALIGFMGDEYALADEDVTGSRKKMNGIFCMIWRENQGEMRFLWIDSRDGICRSSSFSIYEYEDKLAMKLFGAVLNIMAAGIPQIVGNQNLLGLETNEES